MGLLWMQLVGLMEIIFQMVQAICMILVIILIQILDQQLVIQIITL